MKIYVCLRYQPMLFMCITNNIRLLLPFLIVTLSYMQEHEPRHKKQNIHVKSDHERNAMHPFAEKTVFDLENLVNNIYIS